MPTKFNVLAVFVLVTALLLVAALAFVGGGQSPTYSWEAFAAFVGAGLLAQVAAMDFGRGGGQTSLAFLPFITGALIFPPLFATLVVVVVVGITEIIQRTKRPTVAVFNVGQASISIALSALVYEFASNGASEPHLGAFALAATTFFGANILFGSLGIAFAQGVSWSVVIRQVVGPLGGNLLYDLLASPIAIVIAYLYADHGVIGLAIVILPLMLVRHSYSSRAKLEQANMDLLKVLVKTIETRDPYTSGHSIRVSELAKSIAADMGLSSRKIEMVGVAALLHDIGKIDAIYTAVIQKPHDLTDEERALIRTHAARGADLLESLTLVESSVVKAVRHHHERYDGGGYPDGIAGAEIPLAARIIMLCDSIDAMLSDRPYRKALPIQTVQAELARCAGTQFDPDVVRAVLEKNTLTKAAAAAQAVSGQQRTFSGGAILAASIA